MEEQLKADPSQTIPTAINPGAGVMTQESPRPSLLPNEELLPSRQIRPQECTCGGAAGECTCGAAAQSYIYAIGTVMPRFPSLNVEKEFLQSVSMTETQGVPDQSLLYQVLSQGQNLYLAREMCWVFRMEDVDIYLLQPRSYIELNNLIAAIKPSAGRIDFDMVLGVRGPIASPSMCNGLQLPVVTCNQVYSFSYDEFVTAIVKETGAARDVAGDMFNQMLQMTDNAGETDEHRALNYITLRYMGIYRMANDMANAANDPRKGTYTLTSVNAEPSRLAGTRRVIDVIFAYSERVTGEVVKWFTRVDVTGQFPFLVSKLSRYYSRP